MSQLHTTTASAPPPRLIVISGPSGTGKSTILTRLFAKHPSVFSFTISHTTRAPRPGEREGQHYYFVDRPTFERMIDANEFVEHAQFSGNRYGTSLREVRRLAGLGKRCVLDIEMEGVKQLKKTDLDARFLFLAPPSFEELEKRLRGRGTDSEEAVAKRLAQAKAEMEFAETGAHDLVVVNDDLEKALKQVEEFCLKD